VLDLIIKQADDELTGSCALLGAEEESNRLVGATRRNSGPGRSKWAGVSMLPFCEPPGHDARCS